MNKTIKIILVIVIALLEINVNAHYKSSSKIENNFITEKYSIRLNGNGGIFCKQDKIIIAKKHIKLPTPKKEGYIFSHYSSVDSDYDLDIENVTDINNKELYAKWEIEDYQITYNLNGGTSEQLKKSYTIEDEFELPVPKKENYIFLGWTGSNGTIPTKSVKVSKGTMGDLYYEANWQEKKYKVKVISEIDEIVYEYGKENFTFNVWIDNELIENNIYYYEKEVSSGTKVRIQTIEREGIETNYDSTIIVENDYEFKPKWIIKEYDAEFYLNGLLAKITKNKYGSKVSIPTVDINNFGYSNDFYYIEGYTPLETWYQPAHTISFNINIAEHDCMTSFGSAGISNAYSQLNLLKQRGINNCGVNESWNALECYGKSQQIIELYNNVWNILPYSGNGYSRYKQMSCNSGYITSSNR